VANNDDTSKQILARLDEHAAKLDQHTAKLDQHTAKLDQHTAKLDQHTAKLEEHDRRFDHLQSQIDTIVEGVGQIAITQNEHGQMLRGLTTAVARIEDRLGDRLDDHEARIKALESGRGQ
jgi:chromosome segregation ATPase